MDDLDLLDIALGAIQGVSATGAGAGTGVSSNDWTLENCGTRSGESSSPTGLIPHVQWGLVD